MDEPDEPRGRASPRATSSRPSATHRLAKLKDLADAGIRALPGQVRPRPLDRRGPRQVPVAGARATPARPWRVAGRIMLLRRHGRLVFADLHDQTGTIQLFVARTSATTASRTSRELDRGDWVGVERRGHEDQARRAVGPGRPVELLAKALRPLPDKWHGLTDTDTRLPPALRRPDRQPRHAPRVRHPLAVDRRRCARRSTERGFVEVETPVLAARSRRRGGAAVRHPPQRARHRHLPAHRARAATSSGSSSAASSGCSRSAASSATRASTPATTPSSRCSSSTRRSRDYHDMMDLTEAIVAHAARDALGTHGRVDGRRRDRPRAAVAAAHDGRPDRGARRRRRCTRRCRSTRRGRSATGSTSRYESAWGAGQADARGLREDDRGHAHGADLRLRLPARGLAARRGRTATTRR